jgi:hypothetical protein
MYVIAAFFTGLTLVLAYVFFLAVPGEVGASGLRGKLAILALTGTCALAASRAIFAERKYEADEAQRSADDEQRTRREQRAFAKARRGLEAEPPPAKPLPQPPRIGADPFREPPARAPIVVERPSTGSTAVPRAEPTPEARVDPPKLLG